MNVPATTDLADAHETLFDTGELRVLPGPWQGYGQHLRFAGAAVTLKLHEDNSLLAAAVKEAGQGRVLVVDAGASMRCAVLGGNLAQAAAANGWAGIVVWGAVRDADEIDACALGVRALGLCPRRSIKRGQGARDLPVEIGGARVAPGDWIVADRDGVLAAARVLTV